MLNSFKRNKESFPQETEDGKVYIAGDKLYFIDHGYEESVDLSILKYAYVEILSDRPFLFLFDYQQHYICCLQHGFAKAYTELSERFGFDDAAFFKIANSKKEQKQRIWIQSQKKNYHILDDTNKDYTEGFEVLSQPSQFISWDTSYDDIKKLGIGTSYTSEFDTNYFKINYPVRIGSLVMDELEFYDDNDRKEIAVQSFFATLNNGNNTDDSYKELRKLWMEEIPTKVKDAGYERKDQKYLSFDLGDISLSICYTYDSEQYDDGCTSLSISNYRDYSDIILRERDDLQPESTEIITFKSLLQFMPDYTSNAKVTAKPKLIEKLAGHKQALYFNKETNRFGFTSDQYAIEFACSEVEQISIQNVLPAKGGGYAELSIKPFGQDYSTTNFYANQNELDEYAEPIEKLLNIKVIMPEPYYNC
ncbi:hypothetical protein [Sphingobacterium bovistauri]|uniref:Uncharacterized protein n=1 Tax=Sphingobacterium bovistauri TaxID=2781959 RepID=A0ABS7Z8R4_9SPHI|nr:hypothetical protein [Sphingobacterium bovistauri]MCA5005084.1 hypothetical protein [Sphingobacterium bovistauri]